MFVGNKGIIENWSIVMESFVINELYLGFRICETIAMSPSYALSCFKFSVEIKRILGFVFYYGDGWVTLSQIV